MALGNANSHFLAVIKYSKLQGGKPDKPHTPSRKRTATSHMEINNQMKPPQTGPPPPPPAWPGEVKYTGSFHTSKILLLFYNDKTRKVKISLWCIPELKK